jgi:hypothetical protein
MLAEILLKTAPQKYSGHIYLETAVLSNVVEFDLPRYSINFPSTRSLIALFIVHCSLLFSSSAMSRDAPLLSFICCRFRAALHPPNLSK